MAFYYNLPTDDRLNLASLTSVNGTVNASYPLTNMQNDNLAQPTKYTAAAGNTRITVLSDVGGALAAANAIRFAAWFNLNYTAAQISTFNFISDTSAVFAAPGTRATFAVTYSGLAADNFSIDPYLATSLAAASARQYWYLDITTGSTFNTPAIGRWWMSITLRSFTRGFRYDDFGPERGHPAISHQTNMGVTLAYPLGLRTEILSGTICCDTTDFAALKTLYDVAGETRAFPIVPDSAGGTIFIGATEAMLVRFSPGYRFAPRFTPNAGPGLMDVPVSFSVVARGLGLA